MDITVADDREALVRFDLAQTARRAGDACAALVIETATTPAQWLAVASNLRSARTVRGSHVPGLYAAHEAAEALSRDNLDGALDVLADGCGMPVSQWLELTRNERAEVQS